MAASRNIPPADLLAPLRDFVATRIAPDVPVSIGLSGGCDSVVLLHLLSRLGLGARLRAVHVHHGLSVHADAWADFCAGYARRLDIELSIRHVRVARDDGRGLEAAARAARYAAFVDCVGSGCLLLAQHRGDQAETLLLNLLRGSGINGAAAMRSERRHGAMTLLRPLLGVPRAAIEGYARAQSLDWIDDDSNADTDLSRNFLRHEVLTVIHQRFPEAETNLARAAGHFAEAVDLLDELAAADWLAVADGEAACLPGLRALSSARLKNLLRWRLRMLGWQVPVAARLEEFVRQLLTAAPDRHPELRLPAGRMYLARGRLHWQC